MENKLLQNIYLVKNLNTYKYRCTPTRTLLVALFMFININLKNNKSLISLLKTMNRVSARKKNIYKHALKKLELVFTTIIF